LFLRRARAEPLANLPPQRRIKLWRRGMEARRAETLCGSVPLHDSPARKGDARQIAFEQKELAGRIAEQVLREERLARRRTTMSTKRNKMTKEEESALFQKASEAMRLFGENPDAARGFLDALKKGDFSGARISINASLDRRREGDRATADRNQLPSDKGKK
jgi:hypothetical protein